MERESFLKVIFVGAGRDYLPLIRLFPLSGSCRCLRLIEHAQWAGNVPKRAAFACYRNLYDELEHLFFHSIIGKGAHVRTVCKSYGGMAFVMSC